MITGACRGVVFGGAIAPNISAPGVTPTFRIPSPAFSGGLLIVFDYLVNLYFLSATGKFLCAPVKVRK